MSSKIKILIVEDERIVGEDIKNSLETLGYYVSNILPSGEMVLAEIEKTPPDVILMDIVLDGKLSGIDVAEKIKDKHNIPVIYLTAYANKQIIEKAKFTEPYGYILKPFNILEIQSTLEMALYKFRMERKLKKRNIWISSVLGSIADGVIATDMQGRVTFINSIAEDLIGSRKEDIIHVSIEEVFDLVDENTNRAVKDYLSKLLKNENVDSSSWTAEMISKSGSQITIDCSIAPIINDKKNIQGVVVVFRDVTERKEMGFTLRARNLELGALNTIANEVNSTLDLKTIVNKALDEIMRIMDFSKGCAFIYNEDSSKVVVESFRNISKELSNALLFYHENKSSDYWRKLNKGNIQSFLTKEVLKENNYKFKKDPEESSLYWLIVPLKVKNQIIGSLNFLSEKLLSSQDFGYYFFTNVGNQIGVAAWNARLYERTKQTLIELKITQKKLVESEKLIGFGEMASCVVHEIGNPLGSISNSIQILQKKLDVDGNLKELMNIIDWETERLNKSVDQLRELYKQRRYEFEKNNLRDVVKRGLLIINKDFELVMGKDIEMHFSRNLPPVKIDSDAIQQVVFNLVKNALQASDKGEKVVVRVKRSTRDSKQYLALEVKDYGKGIPENDIDTIFEPYYTNKSKGMGLGMHVVKQNVEAHNGIIDIKSIKGAGTTVTVLIPINGADND